MYSEKTVKRARVMIAAGEAICAAAGLTRNDAVDCIHSLISGFEGEPPPRAASVVQQTDANIIAAAYAVLKNRAAIDAITEWNTLVSPHADPLRFVKARVAPGH